MAYQSRIRRSVQRHQVNYITDSDSDTEHDNLRSLRKTPPSAPQLRTVGSTTLPGREPSSLGPALSEPAALSSPILQSVSGKANSHSHPHLGFQGFDSPQQTQLSGPKSPEWHQTDVENKENALPEQSSASKQLVHQAVPAEERAVQRIETVEQDLLQHKQRIRTQLESMQEQLTALSQNHLNTASLPEQVACYMEQGLGEVIAQIERQLLWVEENLPTPADWVIMEQAVAALLDEGAERRREMASLQEQAARLPAMLSAEGVTETDDAAEASAQAEDSLPEDDATGSAGSSSLDIAVKQEEDEHNVSAIQPPELQILLQQHETDMQTQLMAINEKLENWVCQCFTDLRNRIVALESAAEAAKVMPQTSDAATSCSDTDLATSSTEDPSNPAAEAQLGSPGRTYMQLYSAKEMNEDVGTEAQVRKHREAQSDRAIGQAALAGGQHVPLPVVPELEAHTADSALGMAKAVLHGNFTLIPRHKQQMLARLAILTFGGCAALGSIAIRHWTSQATCFPT